jgi:hypothetical protein
MIVEKVEFDVVEEEWFQRDDECCKGTASF